MTISVGDFFPKFSLKAVDGKKFEEININNVFIDISNEIYRDKWLTIFFYPKDFTFVCPTEITAFTFLHELFTRITVSLSRWLKHFESAPVLPPKLPL